MGGELPLRAGIGLRLAPCALRGSFRSGGKQAYTLVLVLVLVLVIDSYRQLVITRYSQFGELPTSVSAENSEPGA